LWSEPLRAAGLRCSAQLVHRRQVSALVEVTRREGADLLVVGRDSRHGLADIAVGAGFDHLVHAPPCPLVVVPDIPWGDGTTKGGTWHPMRRAILDVDDPATARRAWRWCTDHLSGGATVVMVRHQDEPTGRPAFWPLDPTGEWEQGDLSPGTPRFEGGPVDGIQVLADPGVTSLLELIASQKPDIVVVSRRRRSRVSGLARVVSSGELLGLIDGASCPVVLLATSDRSESSRHRSVGGYPPPDEGVAPSPVPRRPLRRALRHRFVGRPPGGSPVDLVKPRGARPER